MCAWAGPADSGGSTKTVTARRAGLFLAVILAGTAFGAQPAYAQSPSAGPPDITQLSHQAETDLHEQRPAQAVEKYQKILAAEPDNIGALSNLGLAYYMQKNFPSAAKEFDLALRHNPNLWNIVALCGLSEAQSGQDKSARAHLEAAFQHVAEPSLRLAVGKQLFSSEFETGDLNQAAEIVVQLQQLDPKNIDIMYAAHQVYSLLADRAFLSVARLQPDSARMFQLWGDRMTELGDTEGAIVAYRMAIQRDPNLSSVHVALADALNNSRSATERAQAESEYQKALAIDPQDERAECKLGDIEFQRSNHEGATHHYRRALQLRPDDPDANEGLGMVLFSSRSYAEARVYLARAVQLDPTNATDYYHLSQASRETGDLDEAKREMSEFLKLKAESENLKRSFGELPLERARQNTP